MGIVPVQRKRIVQSVLVKIPRELSGVARWLPRPLDLDLIWPRLLRRFSARGPIELPTLRRINSPTWYRSDNHAGPFQICPLDSEVRYFPTQTSAPRFRCCPLLLFNPLMASLTPFLYQIVFVDFSGERG
jgi:hypothetical protein